MVIWRLRKEPYAKCGALGLAHSVSACLSGNHFKALRINKLYYKE